MNGATRPTIDAPADESYSQEQVQAEWNETDWPLVTFAVFAFNQERYIEAAVQAALEQDYPQLELILSDDCSTDTTYELMRRAVEGYSGPHRVVLNRNSKNLQLGGHINLVGRLASSELLVFAAGDDISEPNRTKSIVRHWLQLRRQPAFIYSDFHAIDARAKRVELRREKIYRGKHDPLAMARGRIHVLGATSAITRDLLFNFDPLGHDLRHEDRVLPFRAMLSGGVVSLIDQKLVCYRIEGGMSRNIPASADALLLNFMPQRSLGTLPDAKQRLKDVDCKLPERSDLKRECLSTISDQMAIIALANAKSLELEIRFLKWSFSGARLGRLLKFYLKRRFIWWFRIYYDLRFRRARS